MKRKVIKRALLGFPLGVFIGYTITVVLSLFWGNGHYSPAVPQLVQQTGSEVGAVALQYLLAGVLGAACAAGSCVWDMCEWSLLKQVLVHLLVMAGSLFPVAWFAWWMPHSLVGVLRYVGVFLVIYAVIFLGMLLYWRRRVRQMNDRIHQEREP